MTINELVVAYPLWSLGAISIVITLISTLAHKWLTNQEQMTNLKKRQKEIQKQLKGCKDDQILKELNLEIMQITGTLMKASMKPMIFTIIPFLIIFAWVREVYPPILDHWFWWYFGFAIVSSMILRKVLKVA